MDKEGKTRIDVGQEAADIRRLLQAGQRTDDPETIAAGLSRADKLGKKSGFSITNPTVRRILGIPVTTPRDDD